jgi:hypothetical protein
VYNDVVASAQVLANIVGVPNDPLQLLWDFQMALYYQNNTGPYRLSTFKNASGFTQINIPTFNGGAGKNVYLQPGAGVFAADAVQTISMRSSPGIIQYYGLIQGN